MKYSVKARAITIAAISSILAAGVASASSAEEGEAPILGLTAAGVLTLPDADGVRDITSVTISSSLPTEITATLVPAGGGDPVKVFAPVSLTAESLSANVEIPVTGLAAGTYDFVASPSAGDAATTSLTVGSGEPSTVSLSLSASKIYTWTKVTPRSTSARVSATDETGLTVPFVGSVKATVGGKTSTVAVTSTDGSTKSAGFSVTKFGYGTGTVVATVHGASLVNYTSNVASLKVVQTAVSSVKIAPSVSTVYPSKDSYRDTVKLTVTPTTTTGTSFASTGTVKITRGTKTIKTWKLTSSKAWSATWDGKVSGKIVPGTYTVTVSLKGPEGSTRTAKSTVKVDSGKLVTKTKTVTYKAHSILKNYVSFDEYDDSYCAYNNYKSEDFGCIGYDAYYSDTLSVIGDGSVAIPSYVLGAQKYATPTVSVSLHTTHLSGVGAWSIGDTRYGDTKVGTVSKGTRTLSSLKLPTGSKRVYVTVGLGEYSWWVADTITVKYTYKVMTH